MICCSSCSSQTECFVKFRRFFSAVSKTHTYLAAVRFIVKRRKRFKKPETLFCICITCEKKPIQTLKAVKQKRPMQRNVAPAGPGAHPQTRRLPGQVAHSVLFTTKKRIFSIQQIFSLNTDIKKPLPLQGLKQK